MKTNPHKTSKFRGVSWKTQAQRWSVQLVVSDLHVHVGEFIDEIPAAKAYGEDAHGRWPIGRDDEDLIHFCGAARCAGSSYCEVHRNRSLLGGDVRYQWRGWHVRLSQK
jgi:hypothetical protein